MKRLIPLFLLIAVLFTNTTGQVQAQTNLNLGWQPTDGWSSTYNASMVSGSWQDVSNTLDYMEVRKVLTAPVNIGDFSITFSTQWNGAPTRQIRVRGYNQTGGLIAESLVYPLPGTSVSTSATITGTLNAFGVYEVRVALLNGNGSNTFNSADLMRNFIFYQAVPVINLTHPIPASARQYAYNHPNTDLSLSVTGTTQVFTEVSSLPSVPVFAPEQVLVTGVSPLGGDDCDTFMGQDVPGDCYVVVPASVTGSSQSNRKTLLKFYSSNTPIYQVFLSGGTADYTLLVSNPNVSPGQYVDETCYLGTTFTAGAIGSATQITAFESNVSVNSSTWYTQNPDPNAPPCDAPPNYEQCVGTSVPNVPEEWDGQSNVTWQSDRVIIAPGGYISKVVLVDLSVPPSMYVYGRSVGGITYADLSLIRVTDASIGVTVSNGFPNTFDEQSVTLSGYTGSHEVRARIKNTGDTPLEIKSICITSGAPPNPGVDCTFIDFDFDTGNSWTRNNAIWRQGSYILIANGSISQGVTALQPGNWYLNIATSAAPVDSGYILDDTNIVDGVVWEYNIGSGWVTLDTLTEQDYANNNNRIVSEVLFNLTVPLTATIQIRASGVGTPVWAARIERACLSTSQYTEEGGLLFPLRCGTAVTVPTGTEALSVWTQWLWVNFWEFYECDLMTVLNGMYSLGLTWYETFGWSIRYGQVFSEITIDWISTSLLPWLAGYFTNMSTGSTTTIFAAEQCNNLFCLLGNLGELILSPIQSLVDGLVDTVDRLLSLIEDVFGFTLGALGGFVDTAYGIIQYLLAVVNDARNLVADILNLWNNTTPASLPFVPTCSSNPQSSGMCIAFWVMEHTIFSGTGAAFIPLLISFGSLLGLIWAARKLRHAINTAGGLI